MLVAVSSTFNSNPDKEHVHPIQFLAWFAIFTFALAWANHRVYPYREQEPLYNYRKAYQAFNYNLIIAGDSRVEQGVSPEVIQRQFPHLRILNFGWNNNGFSPAYLAQVQKRLIQNPKEPRIVLLGVTPHSLSPHSAGNSFQEWNDTHPIEKRLRSSLGSGFVYLTPSHPNHLLRIFFRGPYRENLYGPHGWVGMDVAVNPVSLRRNTQNYEAKFRRAKCLPQLEAALLRQVLLLTRQGVQVFGFFPPTAPEVRLVERNWSGFDEQGFVQRFQEQGGKWLVVGPDEGFSSYDGVHLSLRAADRLSQELAQGLREATIRD